MSKKYLKRAAHDGRMAVLPEFLTEGKKIWYWRECLCEEGEICMDAVTSLCPLNNGIDWDDDVARRCASVHPQLEETEIWSVAAFFTPRGIEWVINDLPGVAECNLRSAFFSTQEAAIRERPRRIVHG